MEDRGSQVRGSYMSSFNYPSDLSDPACLCACLLFNIYYYSGPLLALYSSHYIEHDVIIISADVFVESARVYIQNKFWKKNKKY